MSTEIANLSGANLHTANLTGANLKRANLTGAILPDGWQDIVAAYYTTDDNSKP